MRGEPARPNLPLPWNPNKEEWMTFLAQKGNGNATSVVLKWTKWDKGLQILRIMPGTLYVLNKYMLALIIPVSGEPDTRHWATWWKYVCLSTYWPLTSATPTLILPLRQTHHTHSPGISLMYSFPQSFAWNAFFPQLGAGVVQGARFESQTWFEFWLCHFLAAWSWAG